MQVSAKCVTKAVRVLAAGALMASAGLAQALPYSAFQGRNADGTVNNTCTATGATKCVLIYDSTLNITILNDWSVGLGPWSSIAAAGSAQALAETAGFAATGLTGWMLPTGDGRQAAGALNQFKSIWEDAGGSFANLISEFDGVHADSYWSQSEFDASTAWFFYAPPGIQSPSYFKFNPLYVVAVRSGDVLAALPVPEPESLALVLAGLAAAAGVARRRRPL